MKFSIIFHKLFCHEQNLIILAALHICLLLVIRHRNFLGNFIYFLYYFDKIIIKFELGIKIRQE